MADIIKDDFIKRSDALDLAREYYTPALRESAVPVKAIKNIPSADVVEVKHGEWLPNKYIYDALDCSICGHFVYDDDIPNFCPNCGADMRMDGGT